MAEIELIQGDITTVPVDVVVNGTTARVVIGGGSLDKAVHQAAGPLLLTELQGVMDERKTIALGEGIVTDGYKMPCKKIIHTACPMYMGGGWQEAESLAACYRSSLMAAHDAGMESIAFPNLATGAQTFPKKMAAEIAVAAVKETLPATPAIKKVVFVCFEQENYAVYAELLRAG
ncbi:MAG: macro domain-containing protein [Spirochaetaceae bacterium]|jgi:O-acetyl-ADP-ribose deacetylase (regulator of RNase III)|nr:macro domain-containing protein [Spirochaetaceae bacterium]